MNNKKYFEKLLAKGKLEKAIGDMLLATEKSNQYMLHSKILLLSSRWHRYREKFNANILLQSQSTIEESQIANAFNNYLKEFEDFSDFS